MLLKTDINMLKIIGLMLGLGMISTGSSAITMDCSDYSKKTPAMNKVCSASLAESREKITDQYFTAFLITDAPVRLLQDSQQLWATRLQQCKTLDCFKQQFEWRLDDLNVYISLNQSLTQHYIKFEQGQIAKQPVHLKIHQLTKDRIKVEGLAYRNPNNRAEKQIIPFLAYTTPETKNQITDNENDCRY